MNDEWFQICLSNATWAATAWLALPRDVRARGWPEWEQGGGGGGGDGGGGAAGEGEEDGEGDGDIAPLHHPPPPAAAAEGGA